ncbi:MAG: YfhO family protein, partial [Chloroflexota bacterium]|nr:YfhO family protein [Chloroflexota bacterium]
FDWEGPLVFVYGLPFVRGDYYVTANWQADDPAESTEATLDRLAADPRIVLLDGDPGIPPAPALAAVVRVLRAEPGDWSFAVDAGGSGVLVLNQSALPGWAASVDGRPVDLLTANRLVLAVPVPAGASQVEFSYSPPGYEAGIVFSLIGLGLLLVTGVAVAAVDWKGSA